MSMQQPNQALIESLLAEYMALKAAISAQERRRGELRSLLLQATPGAYGSHILAITSVAKPEHVVPARIEQHVKVSRRD